jgi:hypothetical protein
MLTFEAHFNTASRHFGIRAIVKMSGGQGHRRGFREAAGLPLSGIACNVPRCADADDGMGGDSQNLRLGLAWRCVDDKVVFWANARLRCAAAPTHCVTSGR